MAKMVSKNTFSILLYVRRGKLLKNGEARVFLRVTVRGKRMDLSTNLTVDPDQWDSNKGQLKNGVKNAADKNSYLENLKFKVREIKREITDKGYELTAKAVKDFYLGNVQENRGVIDFFDEHNQRCKELEGRDFASGTVERYYTCRKLLAQFIRSNYQLSDLPIKSVDFRFIKEFEHFFKTVRQCNHNTTVKYLMNFKKIIRQAKSFGLIHDDPFKNISYRYEQVDPEYLSLEELNRIRTRKFTVARIERVRDVFVFCCFTGLAFCDVKSLTLEDISIGIDGQKWIKKKRRKTNKLSSIPLLDVPQRILEKYQDDPECVYSARLLPVLTNQKMNAYLKEIADLSGIGKKLTTHTARHTFATTVTLSNSISIEAVSEMLGHSSLQMTKKYARIVDNYLKREMDKLKGKFPDLSNSNTDGNADRALKTKRNELLCDHQ